MKEKHTLHHNSAEKRYEFDLGDCTAIVEYIQEGNVMTLPHTFVPEKYEGKGIGSELVKAVLEDIRKKDMQVVPQCQFIAQYIYRHPEWEDLIVKEVHAN